MSEKHIGEVVQVIGPVLDNALRTMNCRLFSMP